MKLLSSIKIATIATTALEFTDVVGYEKVLTTQMSTFCRVASPLNEEGDAFAPNQQAHRDYTVAAIVRAVGCDSCDSN